VPLNDCRFIAPRAGAAPTRFGVGGADLQGGGYDATRSKGKRKTPTAKTLWEDDELRPMERQILTTSGRDLQRNFAVVAWAIAVHLNYVSTFTFQSRTGNDATSTRRSRR
jgi:hypothetical protein